MNKPTKIALLISVGVLAAAGCLVSGTFVRSLHINSFYSNSEGDFEAHNVDLTTDQVWQEHQDDIKNISDVRFRAKIANLSGVPATGQVYFSNNATYTTPEAVKAADDAFLVFSGMVIAGGAQRTITFAESAKYRQNLDEALKLVETGKLSLYVLTSEATFQLHVTDVWIMVTFDAGPA